MKVIDDIILRKLEESSGKNSGIDIDLFYSYLLSTPWGRESIRRTYLDMVKNRKNSKAYKNLYFSSIEFLYSKYAAVSVDEIDDI
ncbi:MAG: hypothetical protein KAS39_08255, partial [Actinomycetia bacterium]|nr:hypothetical protein [Actinomycetes bacterium]